MLLLIRQSRDSLQATRQAVARNVHCARRDLSRTFPHRSAQFLRRENISFYGVLLRMGSEWRKGFHDISLPLAQIVNNFTDRCHIVESIGIGLIHETRTLSRQENL